ncbi:unnamed protein product [Protopolystoma xenopodis]|uniref:Uncharacterized protein n=1 Tax=Protopolystoma xenopodis TaxID=117903 RepID=A0A448X1S6_9PLAT|nr:unnamed protein product [Protopolystoma xenopodis]
MTLPIMVSGCTLFLRLQRSVYRQLLHQTPTRVSLALIHSTRGIRRPVLLIWIPDCLGIINSSNLLKQWPGLVLGLPKYAECGSDNLSLWWPVIHQSLDLMEKSLFKYHS